MQKSIDKSDYIDYISRMSKQNLKALKAEIESKIKVLIEERDAIHKVLEIQKKYNNAKTVDPNKVKIMFAIAFDLDTDKLKRHYGSPSWQNAYGEIRQFFHEKRFRHKQGSIYYAHDDASAVTVTLAVVELSQKYPYIKHCIDDIRILELVRNDDLSPAIAMGNP